MSPSSRVSPDFDRASTASSVVIMPRSPWLASLGWTNWAGVPVEASVAAIFRRDRPITPSGSTVIEPDDEVFFLAAQRDISTVLDEFQQSARPARRIILAGGGNIGRNLAHDEFRSAAYRREESQERVDHQQQAATPEAAAIESDRRRAVADALQRLPSVQREVLILRFYHDMKLEEIAAITDAPLGTVKSRLFHALKGAKRFLAGMTIYE